MELARTQTRFLAHQTEDKTRAQTILEHLQGTAALAQDFGAAFGAEEQARLAGLLHDIGKYSETFQKRLQGQAVTVDHSTAGAKEAFARRQLEAAFAVAGHHAGLPDGGAATDSPEGSTLCARMKRTIPSCDAWHTEQPALPSARRPLQIPPDNLSEAFYIRMLYSCLVDADFLDTETFMLGRAAPRGGYDSIPVLFQRLQQYIAPWQNPTTPLNQKRCEILEQCLHAGQTGTSGLYTLTVPTGGGKTISSLAFALAHAQAAHKDRVIYVIPYTSIIDQTAEIFRKVLGEENVIEHHSGADYQVNGDQTDSSFYRKALAAENWDAPVIVTTSVQFFESLYGNRSPRCRKLHNIANSVVIFDEAQTLPVSYLRPCVEAIGQLVQYYQVAAVLCTATQPALQPLFAELAPHLSIREICPDTQALYTFFRRTTLCQAGTLSLEDLAVRLNAQTQTLCVINRRAIVQELGALVEPEGCYCLTTLLCPVDRKRLLRQIRSRLQEGLPCRVISTSLIEAGVDVDFPAAWREEAGLDSILQTAGRCNREGKRAAADSLVSVFRLEGMQPLSLIRTNVDSTRSVLARFSDPASPQAIEAYFSFYRTLKGNAALDIHGVLDAFRKGYQGCLFPFATVAEWFHLIETPTVTLYIPIDQGQSLIDQLRAGNSSRSLYRQLGQYAVNVYPNHLQNLLDAGAAEPLAGDNYVLTDLSLYSHDTGLTLQVETGKALFG